jgi:signal transduction histidine kinase
MTLEMSLEPRGPRAYTHRPAGCRPLREHLMTGSREDWIKLISLAVHEFRTPLTTAAGYLRMITSERMGPLPEPQRKLLQEAERSCARLASLVGDLSEVANLEAGTASFNRQAVDVFTLVEETTRTVALPPERIANIELRGYASAATVLGDPVRLRHAFAAILSALLRNLVRSERIVVHRSIRPAAEDSSALIVAGDAAVVDEIVTIFPRGTAAFDEWLGGCGLGLVIARHVIEAHQGRLLAAAGERALTAAAVELPLHSTR